MFIIFTHPLKNIIFLNSYVTSITDISDQGSRNENKNAH